MDNYPVDTRMESVDDLPSGPCEWEWSEEDAHYFTSCNAAYQSNVVPEYCPNCQGKIETIGDEEDEDTL